MRRIVIAAIGGFLAHYLMGRFVFALPSIQREYLSHPNLYRSHDGVENLMPLGLPAMFVAILALAVLYAMVYQGKSPVFEGIRFGLLIAVFGVGSFVVHEYVSLQENPTILIFETVGHFIQWLVVGVVIALLYEPAYENLEIPQLPRYRSQSGQENPRPGTQALEHDQMHDM
jgi:hypothetical protein